MKCQQCLSERILFVRAKCSDCCFVVLQGQEKVGYVPYDLGIGGGDFVKLSLCMDCGQTQGKYPIPPSELE